MTVVLANILTTSKRSPIKLESDRGSEWYNSVFKNCIKNENIHHCSGFTEKRPSIAERVIRTLRNFLKRSVFLAGKADWLRELPSVVKQYNNTIHNSTKMKPIDASEKSNEKLIYTNLKDNREKQKPKF